VGQKAWHSHAVEYTRGLLCDKSQEVDHAWPQEDAKTATKPTQFT